MADVPKVPGLTPAQQDIVNAGTASNRPVVVSSTTTPEGTTTSVGIKNPDGSLVQHTVGTNTQTGETTTQVIVKYPDNTTVGTTGTVKDGQVVNSGQIVVNPDGSRVITDSNGQTRTYPPPEKGDSGRVIIGDVEAPEQPAPNPPKKPEKPVPDKKPSEKKPPEDSPDAPSEKPEDGPSEDNPGETGKNTGCPTGEDLPAPESSIWDDIVDFATGFVSGVAEALVEAAKWALVGAAVIGTVAAGLAALGVSAATLATIGAVAGVALLVVGAIGLGQQIGNLINNLDALSILQIGNEIGKITTNGVLLGTAAKGLAKSGGLKTPKGALTAADEVKSLGSLAGKSNAEIAAQLKAAGYSPTTGKNGGTIWTKALPDGNTVAVRVDPAMVRPNPRGFADEVPHIHKEIVPTNKVTSGNYKPSDAIKLDDNGLPSTDPTNTHIPGGH